MIELTKIIEYTALAADSASDVYGDCESRRAAAITAIVTKPKVATAAAAAPDCSAYETLLASAQAAEYAAQLVYQAAQQLTMAAQMALDECRMGTP